MGPPPPAVIEFGRAHVPSPLRAKSLRFGRPGSWALVLAACLLPLAACSGSPKEGVRTSTGLGPSASTPSVAPSPSPNPSSRPISAPSPSATALPTDLEVQSTSWISATVGWILGWAPCASSASGCTLLDHSTDGGTTWNSLPVPAISLMSPSGSRYRVRFADALDGWIWGSQVWATHDGGSTWTQVSSLTGSVGDLEATSGYAYALVANASGGSTLWRTPAALDSWVQMHVPESASSASLSVQNGDAWLLEELPAASGGGLVSSLFAFASGITPTREYNAPCGPGLVDAATASTIWVVCASNGAAGSEAKAVYLSTNGGAFLASAGQPPAPGDLAAVAGAGVSALVVSACSGSSILYSTIDSGSTWNTALTLNDGGQCFADLQFPGPGLAVAISGTPWGHSSGGPVPTMYRSQDGGAIWAPLAR